LPSLEHSFHSVPLDGSADSIGDPQKRFRGRATRSRKTDPHGAGLDSNQTFEFEPPRTSTQSPGRFAHGEDHAPVAWYYDCVVVVAAAAAAALAFFRSSCGLGRFLPYVPRKILPRFDRLSPLPIGQLPKKMPLDFK
jgi:hypothetical protein